MKCIMKTLLAMMMAFAFVNISSAACRMSQVCDDYGNNCSAQDICDSALDLPSVDIAPLRPLPSIEIKPLPSLEFPPLGTSKCEYMQVNGNWQNVCS